MSLRSSIRYSTFESPDSGSWMPDAVITMLPPDFATDNVRATGGDWSIFTGPVATVDPIMPAAFIPATVT